MSNNDENETIYVVANNICRFSVDIPDKRGVVMKSVSGFLRTPILKTTDYLIYKNIDKDEITYNPSYDIYVQMDQSSIASMFSTFIELDESTNQYKYKYDIIDCSTRMKYVLGISKLPAEKGQIQQTYFYGNGPNFFVVTCDNMPGSGTIQPNVYVLNSPFVIEDGPGYDGNNFTNLCFRIQGLYGEDVEIEDDLLWQFEIVKIDDKDTDKNPFFRLSNQYK